VTTASELVKRLRDPFASAEPVRLNAASLIESQEEEIRRLRDVLGLIASAPMDDQSERGLLLSRLKSCVVMARSALQQKE
jgi:hypothetical protein